MKLDLILTGDNSPSLYNPELNETYHSKHGARQESEHVYIKSGLNELIHLKEVRVFEMGFGTGLNILLSNNFANQHNKKVTVTSIEAYPLNHEITEKLNYANSAIEQSIFDKLHLAPWEEKTQIDSFLSLTKMNVKLEDVCFTSEFDIVFYDAFGPDKQPHLWTPQIFKKLFELLDDNGILVTYSAKGQVRRDLQSVGFRVERIQGPPGKREMLRAIKD
ncbi:MAG: tRNA (5-methylaminomethyl-2-thiouridine)(34)-methyltransferase MnmD [Salibacteraceae bacterium]